VASGSISDHTKRLVVVAITTVAIACGGGSSSPTSPSAALFTGSWSGSYGLSVGGPQTPMTITLTQSGSTVTGTSIITCNGCGPGRSIVRGTASGQVATVTMTPDGATTPSTLGRTLTINANTMSIQWVGASGVVTGTLTAGTPPGPAPSPSPTPPPSADTKYDGIYDFSVDAPRGGGVIQTQVIPAYVTIRNGVISASDGVISDGQIDRFNAITFTWVCLSSGSSRADFRGHMNPSALTGSNFGEGTYTCRQPVDLPTGVTWRLRQVGR
jgi:hypothetical protein